MGKLLQEENLIPPIKIAGSLLNIFAHTNAYEDEIYELFGQKVLELTEAVANYATEETLD